MGAVEDAVDVAAEFISPYLDKTAKITANDASPSLPKPPDVDASQLVEEALELLQKINVADQGNDPNAPYDGSLVGVVYGLLDLITSLGILPHLSPGVVFRQRPRSVLVASLTVPPTANEKLLSNVLRVLISVVEQRGSGVQPLLSQRTLPDIISGIADLAFSPRVNQELRSHFQGQYSKILASTDPSRLLPILTSFLQQEIPPWLRPRLSKDLAIIPLRVHGVRHTVEFLSLSYLSKNAQMPPEAGGSLSQIPIPLEAITQASRLLGSVPSGMTANEWFSRLAPQLLALLDGSDGTDLSKAAGQIIAGGILNRKSTGAPGAIGWETFAKPIIQAIDPGESTSLTLRPSTLDHILVDEKDLKLALKRLSVMSSSYSHHGLIKRLITPLLLPLWSLFWYAKSRPGLDAEWRQLPRSIILRYMSIACEPKQIETLGTNLFLDGGSAWTFGPGSQGGVEIRGRKQDVAEMTGVEDILSRIAKLDERVNTLLSLLAEANIDDETVGTIFVSVTKRWLSAGRTGGRSTSLLNEDDSNPLDALSDAKLSEAMANKFKDRFARSPRHVVELMGQLLHNFVEDHKSKSQLKTSPSKPNRAMLRDIVNTPSQAGAMSTTDSESEDLISFALSILINLITSTEYKPSEPVTNDLSAVLPSLQYLSHSHAKAPISPLILNASSNLLRILETPLSISTPQTDSHAMYRETLKSALTDLTSPDPPIRAWALSTLRKLINNSTAFSILDIPSITHLLLNVSIADPESYVHTAAIPVVVELAIHAPNPTLRILVDAFVDVDERSLRLKKEEDIVQALDFRLRVGELLDGIIGADDFWAAPGKYESLKMVVEACLSLASRRGNRKKTLSKRTELLELERKEQEEGEAAWGGPIPNLLDPEGENPAEQNEHDELLKIVQGWEDTGIEEDVRIRSSALSILSVITEKRLELLSQTLVNASLQMVLQILVVETGVAKAILRRAAVLVAMGMLRGMDALLGEGKESAAGLGLKQAEEVERVMKWLKDDDSDDLVRGHAENVVEGLETWRMKKLFKVGDEQFKLSANLGLEGNLRGLNVQPVSQVENQGRRGVVIEEIE
jgi:hypothetical protein